MQPDPTWLTDERINQIKEGDDGTRAEPCFDGFTLAGYPCQHPQRGSMSTTIAGHTLTTAQREALDEILDFMRANARDSWMSGHTSPKGDGRWVPINEIFPALSNTDSAKRWTAGKLADLGILKACEILMYRGFLKAVPMEKFTEAETNAYADLQSAGFAPK